MIATMPEQLELFDDAEFSENEAGGRNLKPSDSFDSGNTYQGHHSCIRIGIDEELSSRAAKLLNDLNQPKTASQVSVVWNKRMRTSAGRAWFHAQTSKIELNCRLQALESPLREAEIERTFLHELAHILAKARHPRKHIQPHGMEWKHACIDLGIAGEDRCHSLPFHPRRLKRKFGYRCPECNTVIPRVRRLKRVVACRSCCERLNGGRFDRRFILKEECLA